MASFFDKLAFKTFEALSLETQLPIKLFEPFFAGS